MPDAYQWTTSPPPDFDDVLSGPGGFEFRIEEPEERTVPSDFRPLVDRLNRQSEVIEASLRGRCPWAAVMGICTVLTLLAMIVMFFWGPRYSQWAIRPPASPTVACFEFMNQRDADYYFMGSIVATDTRWIYVLRLDNSTNRTLKDVEVSIPVDGIERIAFAANVDAVLPNGATVEARSEHRVRVTETGGFDKFRFDIPNVLPRSVVVIGFEVDTNQKPSLQDLRPTAKWPGGEFKMITLHEWNNR